LAICRRTRTSFDVSRSARRSGAGAKFRPFYRGCLLCRPSVAQLRCGYCDGIQPDISSVQPRREDSVAIYLRGGDVSPPLIISGAPENTKSLALIIEDPDAPDPKAPKRVWVHWLLYNLPAGTEALLEDASRKGLPKGAETGVSDRKETFYHGPCPPIGRHRYFHKLYALDTTLPSKPLTKAELEAAIQGHVLAEGSLMGTYQKGDP
jgi:Raf kinase inhibitor-like YbhB/YbcL family protein